MATSKKEGKGKANAAKAVQDAAKQALVGFDAAVVARAFRAMDAQRAVIDEAQGTTQEAAVVLCIHAFDVAEATREAGGTPSDSAWSKGIKAMLPMLAKEGSRFVKVSEAEDGTPRFKLTGYGQNVNSIARGYVQYSDINPAEATNAEGEAEMTFGTLRKQVQERRKLDRSDEEKALAEAREALSASIKAFRKTAGSTDLTRLLTAIVLIDDADTLLAAEDGAAEVAEDDDDTTTTDDTDAEIAALMDAETEGEAVAAHG